MNWLNRKLYNFVKKCHHCKEKVNYNYEIVNGCVYHKGCSEKAKSEIVSNTLNVWINSHHNNGRCNFCNKPMDKYAQHFVIHNRDRVTIRLCPICLMKGVKELDKAIQERKQILGVDVL